MKARAYVRIAKGVGGGRRGYKFAVSSGPNHEPLTNSHKAALPTVAFALDLDIPDELFKQAEKVVAEINITAKQAKIAAEVRVP